MSKTGKPNAEALGEILLAIWEWQSGSEEPRPAVEGDTCPEAEEG